MSDISDLNQLCVKAFHGTNLQYANSILESGFYFRGDEEGWLGQGVYFFLDGVCEGLPMAKDWSEFRYAGSTPVVVMSDIVAPMSSVLDLRSMDQLREFHKFRLSFAEENSESLSKRRDLRVKKRRDIRLDDAIIAKAAMEALGKSVLIHNIYIKTRKLRELQLESSYPTCTACCVSNISFIKRSQIID